MIQKVMCDPGTEHSYKGCSWFSSEGDSITIKFGDRSGGSPGMRLQTFCEDSYEFHTLIDPIATYNYQPMPISRSSKSCRENQIDI